MTEDKTSRWHERWSSWSLKRLAWAYGTSKKGSEEERELGIALVSRVWGSDERRAPQRLDQIIALDQLISEDK